MASKPGAPRPAELTLGSPQHAKIVDYTAKLVVRGGVEPPTFRFSEVLSAPGSNHAEKPSTILTCKGAGQNDYCSSYQSYQCVPHNPVSSVGFLWGALPGPGLVGILWGYRERSASQPTRPAKNLEPMGGEMTQRHCQPAEVTDTGTERRFRARPATTSLPIAACISPLSGSTVPSG
jgi:hypothetical protein